VEFFRPLKEAWEKGLQHYFDRNPSAKPLAKEKFPHMIKEVLGSLTTEELLPKAWVSQ
jgi:hypothetical protein